ncbi:MAG: hypothetical protein MJD61_12855 [Proteobacteria bacterium]|nr:hypothetical protein [Pseudomonadota bacterium]
MIQDQRSVSRRLPRLCSAQGRFSVVVVLVLVVVVVVLVVLVVLVVVVAGTDRNMVAPAGDPA